MQNDVAGTVAEPLLASRLADNAVFEGLFERARGIVGPKGGKRRLVLCTGVKSLDEALQGGLECGRIVGVHAEAGAGGGELCRRLIVDSLLKYEGSSVAIIDTTGNFHVLRLYTLILGRLKSSPNVLPTSDSTTQKLEDVAARVLDRVKIMRAFDFVGVKEAVSEIRESFIEKERATAQDKATKENPTAQESSPKTEAPAVRKYVADSEDEEDSDEMLFDSESVVAQPEPTAQESDTKLQDKSKGTPETKQQDKEDDNTVSQSALKLILIDNLAQVVNPLLKKDYIQTNTLILDFLHDLADLTRTQSLHTILLNPAAAPRSTSPTRQAPRNNLGQPIGPHKQQHQQPPPSPSIFASATVVPSLMSVLGPYVDVGLLVTKMPRKERDARLYYSDSAEDRKRRVEMVSVMEVVSDRWGGRVGAWGTFDGGEGGAKHGV